MHLIHSKHLDRLQLWYHSNHAHVLILSCRAPQLLAGWPTPLVAMQQYSPLSDSLT